MMIFLKSANNELVIEASGWLSASSMEKKVILRRIEEREQEGFKSQNSCRVLRSLNLDDIEVKKEKIAVVPYLFLTLYEVYPSDWAAFSLARFVRHSKST